MSKVQILASRRHLRGRLLVSTAGAACGIAMFASPAQADIVPAECNQVGFDPVLVTCEVPAPATVGQIVLTANDATVVIGSEAVPTTVETGGEAIIMSGQDAQVLDVAAGSSVISTSSTAAFVASNGPAGSVTVDSSGTITGATDGLAVSNQGSGGADITVGTVTGATHNGIDITNGAGAVDLTGTGLLSGAEVGLKIVNNANSDTTASLSDATGGTFGVNIEQNGDGNVTLASDGTISAPGAVAVQVVHNGQGDITFSNDTLVDGAVNLASTAGSGVDLVASFHDIDGSGVTVYANNPGVSGNIDLDVSGTTRSHIEAAARNGDVNIMLVDADMTAYGNGSIIGATIESGDVSILATGDVTSDMTGFGAGAQGDGNASVEVQSVDVQGAGYGIATANTGVGSATIVAHGDILAGGNAIQAYHSGTGNIGVLAEGQVGSALQAVDIDHDGNGDVAVVTKGLLDSLGSAIDVNHAGDGTIAIAAEGGIQSDDFGVIVQRGSAGNDPFGDGDITISTGAVNAGALGILAFHNGNGDIAIATGGPINAVDHGIAVAARGDIGGVTIDVADTVTSANQFGIQVISEAAGDIAITTNAVISGRAAMNIEHYGTGDISIQANADLDGSLGVGGTGNIDVDVLGSITAKAAVDMALALNPMGDTSKLADVRVTGDIVGNTYGIDANAPNGSAIALDIGGTVSGSEVGAYINSGTLDAVFHGDILAGDLGLDATIDSDAASSIVFEGDVTADIGAIVNAVGAGDLSVRSDGAITGATGGMRIEYFGAGSVDVAVNEVSGTQGGLIVLQGLDALDATVTVSGTLVTTDSAAFGAQLGGAGEKSVTLDDAISQDGAGVLLTVDNGSGTMVTIGGTASGALYGVGIDTGETLDLTVNNAQATAGEAVWIEATDADVSATFTGEIEGTTAGIAMLGNGTGAVDVTIGETASVRASAGSALNFAGLSADQALILANYGTITGEGANGWTARLSDAATGDQFDNVGTLSGSVYLGAGDDSLVNEGVLTGSVWGADGADSFVNSGTFTGFVFDEDGIAVTNNAGAVFTTTNALELGGGTFVNAGTLSSGGAGTVFTTEVNGSFVQQAGGSMLVDIDAGAGTSDLLDIVGDASLAGSVNVAFPTLGATNQDFLIVRTAGGDITDAGLMLGTVFDFGPLVNIALDFRTAKELYLTYLVDFTPDGAALNPNQTEIAQEIDMVFGQDENALDALVEALVANVDKLAEYPDAIDQLVPEIYLNTLQTSSMAAQDFSGELGGCTEESGALLKDGKGCVKLAIGGNLYERDASYEEIAFDNGTLRLQGGYFLPLGENLTLGLGLGYDDTLVHNAVNSRAQGSRLQTGASLMWSDGAFSIGGMLSAEWTSYDVERRIFIGNFASTSKGDQDLSAYTGELALSYSVDIGGLYVKPGVSAFATRLHSGAVTEDGGAATDLALGSSKGWYVGTRPSVELGGKFGVGPELIAKPYLRAGVTYLFDNDFALDGVFVDAGQLGDGFTVSSTLEDTRIDLDLGLEMLIGRNSALGFAYLGNFTDRSESHGFRVRASFAF